MKNIFLGLIMAALLSACGTKGGGGGDLPASQGSCIFSKLKSNDIHDLRNALVTSLESRSQANCGRSGNYQQLSAEVVFQLLKYNPNADILSAIENNDITGFLLNIFDEKSCQILELDTESVRLIKQCKWEE